MKLRKGDRVRLTVEGDRVLRKVLKHRNGTPKSNTGTVMAHSKGSSVKVRFDSQHPDSAGEYYGLLFWEKINDPVTTTRSIVEIESDIAQLEDSIACAEHDGEMGEDTSDEVDTLRCELADLKEELRIYNQRR